MFAFVRTSYRKVDLSAPGASDLISKLRMSAFWTALKSNALGPNPVNSLTWPNQMIADITAAKNAFGHQASDGECKDGNLDLCVCKQLIANVFEHCNNTSAEFLLRVVAANIPCGTTLNFKHHATYMADAARSLFSLHPKVLLPLETIGVLVRNHKLKEAKVRVPKVEEDGPPPKKRRQDTHANQLFYSASFRLMQSTYSKSGAKHMQAGITIGGVDPKQLVAAMSSIFGAM